MGEQTIIHGMVRRRDRTRTSMDKNSSETRGEIYIMPTINIGKRNEIMHMEWTKYEGEDVCVNTTIKQGKRIRDIRFYEDKGKAVPRGNAYVIGNGPSRKDLISRN